MTGSEAAALRADLDRADIDHAQLCERSPFEPLRFHDLRDVDHVRRPQHRVSND
jgi:hypothetical protein